MSKFGHGPQDEADKRNDKDVNPACWQSTSEKLCRAIAGQADCPAGLTMIIVPRVYIYHLDMSEIAVGEVLIERLFRDMQNLGEGRRVVQCWYVIAVRVACHVLRLKVCDFGCGI